MTEESLSSGTEGAQRKNESEREPIGLAEADSLRTWTEVLSGVVDEVKVEINGDGIRGRMTDPANVAHIDARLHEPETTIHSQDEIVIGANVSTLHDYLIPLKSSTVDVIVDDNEDLKLGMETDLEAVEMSLISAEVVRDTSLPDLDYPVSFELPGRAFSAAVDLIDAVDKHHAIRFVVDAESETLELKPGRDEEPATVTFDLSGRIDGELSDAESLYSTDYMVKFFESVDTNDCDVYVEMGDEHPVKMTFSPMEGLDVVYLQAPRIRA